LVTRILLKARPTTAQICDRLGAPAPDGLELYLDRLDLIDDDYLARLRQAIGAATAPPGFIWIVEAPIRTLGASFFDLTAANEDHRETLRRVLAAGHAIGASAANVHVVAPTTNPTELSESARRCCLQRAGELLRFYVEGCRDAGMIPQIENVPPVGRMREGAFVFSPIGAAPSDLLAIAGAFPEIRFTVDLSHAALYLNWRKATPSEVEPALRRTAEYQREQTGPTNLLEYLHLLAFGTTTFHVSNASGLLGEGLRYVNGGEDLDRALAPFVDRVPYFVTETIEANPDRADGMREAQTRLLQLIATTRGVVA
jgi:hypothetical protein